MAELTITIPSNRIYMDQLSAPQAESLRTTLYAYNRAKELLYNLKYDAAFLRKDSGNDTAQIKRLLALKLGMQPQEYYITSLQSQTNGMIRSQRELCQIREQEYKARVDARKKKLKALRRKLTMCLKSKESLVRYSKKLRDKKPVGKPDLPSIPKEFLLHYDSKLPQGKAYYLYEVWLDREIRSIRSKIALIEEKGRTDEIKQTRIPARITFGSKAFYRTKDTAPETDMDHWHAERDRRRNSNILFSGRYNSRHKNWLVNYDPDSHVMDITMMDLNVLRLNGVEFPYRGDELKKVLMHEKEKGWSVGYWLEFHTDHKVRTDCRTEGCSSNKCGNCAYNKKCRSRASREYFIVKATISLRDDRLNEDTSTGVIAVDMNLDNLSWSDIDKTGHLLRSGMIRFDLEGKSSGSIDDTLGRACSQIIRICAEAKKPLVMEKIDLVKKSASQAYGRKKANRGTHMFAYKKISAFLVGKAFRNGIGVIQIDPAYTSLMAKIKYMHYMRAPVHVAASYTIGRRGLGFGEKIPQYLQQLIPDKKRRTTQWKQASHLMGLTREVPTKVFLQTLPTFCTAGEWKNFKDNLKHA